MKIEISIKYIFPKYKLKHKTIHLKERERKLSGNWRVIMQPQQHQKVNTN